MSPEVRERLAELRALCAKYRVQRLELFGSAAGEKFDPGRSDVDILVRFQAMPLPERSDACFSLWDELEALFRRQVDLLEEGAATNRRFLNEIRSMRTVIYAA